MQTTKVLESFLKEKKWKEIMQFAIDEETSSLFLLWLTNKSNDDNINTLVKNIPNEYISSFILNFEEKIIPYFIKNYKKEYSKIAYDL